MLSKRWIYQKGSSSESDRGLADYSAPIRQVLLARGIGSNRDARQFFNPDPAGTESDPLKLKGMARAVQRTKRGLSDGEPIVVYGDYDADGVCSSALVTLALRRLGARIHHYIPDRFSEGYGVNSDAVKRIAEDGAGLLLTVDCGIRAVEQLAVAARQDLDVIVTDHHHPGPALPDAIAIINPNQRECEYPFKMLSGVGLAYKLMCALYAEMGRPEPEDLLDLVAIGTVADVTALVGENRTLVMRGIARINSDPRPGVRALAGICGTPIGEVSSTAIGFRLGPRINAAGRLGQTEAAFEILVTENAARAQALAEQLDRLNQRRQALTREAVRAAKGPALLTGPEAGILVAVDSGFHEGVVGLAASRLVEEFYLPAVVGKSQDGEIVGSCRSIPEFHITEALEGAADLLRRFGGHAAAAGFRLEEARLADFVNYLKDSAGSLLAMEGLGPVVEVDALVRLPEMEDQVMRELDRFEPCGHGNPQPVFASREVRIAAKRPVGADGSHLKLTVEQDGRFFDCIGFGLGEMSSELSVSADIAYHFNRNSYAGIVTNQLQIIDIQPPKSTPDLSR